MDNLEIFSPEILLCAFAAAVVLIDLVVDRKGFLALVSVVGLALFIAGNVCLWETDNRELFNGILVADKFAIFFKVLIAGAAIVVILATKDYVNRISRFQGEFYALILFATLGMGLMAATRDLLAIYVSLELASLSLYALVGFLKDSKSGEASLKYLLLGAISSATLLFGIALVFGVTGQTHLEGIGGAIASVGGVAENPALALGLVMMIAGFGFKIASVPFQMWVPDVYEGAPTPITAFLSVASKAAGFAVILRVFIEAFGTEDLSSEWTIAFAALAVFSMTIGNVVAMSQTNIKRMLGYSSIAQAGYLMVGLAAFVPLSQGDTTSGFGPTGILFFLAGYTITNLGAFIAIIAITQKTNSDLISDFAGMGKRAPVLALALTLCLVSLTGLPPAIGMWGKVYLFNTAVQQDLLWLVVLGVINSVISAYYYFRVAKVMWFSDPASEDEVPSSWPLRLSLLITCGGVVALFIVPNVLLEPAQEALDSLMNILS